MTRHDSRDPEDHDDPAVPDGEEGDDTGDDDEHELFGIAEFRAIGHKRLHAELNKMLTELHRPKAHGGVKVRLNSEERANLLPALVAMQELTTAPTRREHDPDVPDWDEECFLLGLNPYTVRKWKQKAARREAE
jgi:hypothetical protein